MSIHRGDFSAAEDAIERSRAVLERIESHLGTAQLLANEALLAQARGREVGPVQPRVVLAGEGARVLLPGDPGY